MNVLEKILEEIDKKADYYETDEQGREHVRMVDMVDVEEIIRSHMDEAKDINVPSNDGWIDRKKLKEEIKSLRFTINGMRNGKTMTNLALEEYRKSILKIIDEQPTYMDDGWISVEERLPEKPVFGEDSYIVQHKCIITPYSAYWDGENWTEDYSDEPIRGIIAWQPLPKAYRRHQKSLTQDAKRHIMDRFTKER